MCQLRISTGLSGSETSTAVRLFGALSCASQMMRRRSGAVCTDMPSPLPPKPSSRWWDRSLKFQVATPLPVSRIGRGPADRLALVVALFLAGLFLAGLAALALTFFLATFFLAIFFPRFITFSLTSEFQAASQSCRGQTFSAFHR